MSARPQPPLGILLVEDEALLLMDMESMVEDCGNQVVAEADCLSAVECLPDKLNADLAFVDVQLARNSSGIDVARLIKRRWAQIVIVFVTANPLKIPADFAGAHGVIPKPFSRAGFLSAMRYIQEEMCQSIPNSARPASFIASPAFATVGMIGRRS